MSSDTFLVAFQRYEADLAAFDANPEAGEAGDDTLDFTAQLLTTAGDPPHVSSAEGAVLALRRVLDDNVIIDTLDEKLVRGVLAFLERGSRPMISTRINELFSRYVAIEAEQYATKDDERADALGSEAVEVAGQIWDLRDQTGNADFIAVRILLGMMLNHCWHELDRIEWAYEDRFDMITLECVASGTTGVVRREATKALAAFATGKSA